jgi:acetyl esterase
MKMTDYSQIIDVETLRFIEKTAATYPDNAVELDIAAQRDTYNKVCAVFYRGRPAGVETKDLTLQGVPLRVYESDQNHGTIVYIHGGGQIVGDLNSHDDVCAEFCAEAEMRVVSVDYRLSPEFKHPCAYVDCVAAVRWVVSMFGGPIVLAGDSGGGNLAAAVVHGVRTENLGIIGQLLIYPGLGRIRDNASYKKHVHAPMLTVKDMEFYGTCRFDQNVAPLNDPTSTPLDDTDFSGLPPTVVITAECDPLSYDGKEYVAAIRGAGGRAVWIEEAGLVHGYLRARATVKRVQDSYGRMISALRSMRDGDWPYADSAS